MNFETTIRNYMADRMHPLEYYGDAYDKPDFYFPKYDMWVEVKEKSQRYNVNNWPIIQQDTVFIVDEVSVRRMLLYGANTAILVRDNTNANRMYFADLLTLTMMPRKRVNRVVAGKQFLKGKWLLDLRNFLPCYQLTHLQTLLAEYHEQIHDLFQIHSECYGDFMGEKIPVAGTKRTVNLQKSDVETFTNPDPF